MKENEEEKAKATKAEAKKTTKKEDVKKTTTKTTAKAKKESKVEVEKDRKVEDKVEVKKEAPAKKEPAKKATKVEKKVAKAEKKANKTKKAKGYYTSRVSLTITVIAILLVLALIAYVANTAIQKSKFVTENPVATIEIEGFGTVTAELYPDSAPNTVANFITLANNGFYDGLTFHRTIPDFMIQGGDPSADGSGSATLKDIGQDSTDAYAIKGEFILNGFTANTLKHTEGILSMARSDYSSYSSSLAQKGYDSGSCQFFIMTGSNASLDGQYAAFGKVIEGMDVVKAISNVEVQTRDSNSTDENATADMPVNKPVITSIRVDTKGVDYGTPETVEPFDYYSYMMQQYYGSGATTTAN